MNEVAAAIGADLSGKRAVAFTECATDSRQVGPGGLFFALRGAERDGHDFIDDACSRGAAGVVCTRLPAAPAPGVAWLRVNDPWQALFGLARSRLRESGALVVGVTGSVGKTTTKELCAAALSGVGVLKSEGNLNTETGVPLTLMHANREHRAVVLEMGMSAPGEIARLAKLAEPTVAVVTGVGLAHYQYLGSRRAIAEAKAELVASLREGGVAVLNADDPLARAMTPPPGARTILFGRGRRAQYRLTDVWLDERDHTRARISDGSELAEVRLPMASIGAAVDAAAAAAVAGCFEVGLSEACRRMSDLSPVQGRGRPVPGPNHSVLLDDTYNSSPSSLDAALETLSIIAGNRPRVAVLGDMLELGSMTRRAHRRAGERAAAVGLALLIAVGEHAPVLASAALASPTPPALVLQARDANDAVDQLRRHLPSRAVVLVKGSRGVQLDRLVDAVREEA
ncbi:MAG: UDP-N-acetylmuramoyl-tripeptide--D-alanyl-D-alanine ligase [Candidatus Dormibacteria bacterium]